MITPGQTYSLPDGVLDALAQEIRRVDGSNSLGAGALAEALMPFVSSLAPTAPQPTQAPLPAAQEAPEVVEAGGPPDYLWLGAPDIDNEHDVLFYADEGSTKYIRADLASLSQPAPAQGGVEAMVERVECVSYENGYEEPADPIWRIVLDGYCADFPTETAANNFAAAIGGMTGGRWRDDPATDERWNAGLDFAMTHLCKLLGVDTNAVTWDAATETLDGDVMAVLGNILRAKYGEDWGPKP